MTDFREALRLMALEVVGVTDPARVHDDERLRWGDIREALMTELPPETQRKCWQAGKNHLCNKKCENEVTGKEIDDFIAKYRVEQVQELDQQKDFIRRTFEGRWT